MVPTDIKATTHKLFIVNNERWELVPGSTNIYYNNRKKPLTDKGNGREGLFCFVYAKSLMEFFCFSVKNKPKGMRRQDYQ